MDEKAQFAERLRTSMKAAGYQVRPGVLEKEFNSRYWGRSVTFQAVSRWLRGESIPSQEKLQVLADWLKIEPHILRFGEGPIQHRLSGARGVRGVPQSAGGAAQGGAGDHPWPCRTADEGNLTLRAVSPAPTFEPPMLD